MSLPQRGLLRWSGRWGDAGSIWHLETEGCYHLLLLPGSIIDHPDRGRWPPWQMETRPAVAG